MSKWKKRAIELVTGLAFAGKQNPAVIPYVPSKTEVSGIETKHFKRTSPERRGVSSRRIYNMLSELESNPRANVHNIMVIKDGEVISECSRPGYDVNVRHLSHSMSKTVTGMAIGFLISEGQLTLSTRLADLFPEFNIVDNRFLSITVKHLLTMSTGVPFSEAGSVTEDEWTKAFFESRLSFTPGGAFAYNSMNSYILARIVVRLTGMSLTDYLSSRLFRPLGIRNVFWEIGPEGIEKGGWGLHLSAESWGKLGVMMLGLGSFEGRRILPKSWVSQSITTQIKAPESAGDYNYGYQLWVHRENDSFLFNGMLGQNVWICPHNNTVVVANCENNELFQKSAVLEIIEKHLGGKISNDPYERGALFELREKETHFFETRGWTEPLPPKRGITYKLGLRSKTPFVPIWKKALGTYAFPANNHGILPLFIRMMQNNYCGGIESLKLERIGERLFFTSREGGVDYRFEVGLYGFRSTVLNFNGEKYIASAMGEAEYNDDGLPEYKIELIFPEMPNSRRIKFNFGEDGRVILKMAEIPSEKIAEPLVESIYMTNPKLSFAVNMLERRLGDKFINRKLESVFSPTLVGADARADSYRDILEIEKLRADEANRATRAISSLIMKVTGDIRDDE